MRISNQFEVAQPVDKVWAFFGDVPQVAACLPGAQLTEELGDDTYGGGVAVRMGPVKLEFDGRARIVERDDATKRMVIDASGADRKGRGQAEMRVTAVLAQQVVRRQGPGQGVAKEGVPRPGTRPGARDRRLGDPVLHPAVEVLVVGPTRRAP